MSGYIHIHAPPGHYLPQTKRRGCRLWVNCGHKTIYRSTAFMAAAKHLSRTGVKMARVLWVDKDGYYEPNLVMEAKRK